MNDFVLRGSIPGLLRPGSLTTYRDEEEPIVVKTIHGDQVLGTIPFVVTAVSRDRVTLAPIYVSPCLEVEVAADNCTLDLIDPLGMQTALLYLLQRGHTVDWQKAWPDALAWSVLSVNEGGQPLKDIFSSWDFLSSNPDGILYRHDRAGGVRCVVRPKLIREGGSGWWTNGCPGQRFLQGPEIGLAGQVCADHAALLYGVALTREDRTLIFPPLKSSKEGLC